MIPDDFTDILAGLRNTAFPGMLLSIIMIAVPKVSVYMALFVTALLFFFGSYFGSAERDRQAYINQQELMIGYQAETGELNGY